MNKGVFSDSQTEYNFFYNLIIMEYSVAQKVKEAWGAKPCNHPHLEKEYYVGAFLVNWVCTQCGKEFKIADKLEMDQKRKSEVNSQA